MKNGMKKLHKGIAKHLKEDIKGYKKHRKYLKEEIKEDKELMSKVMPKKSTGSKDMSKKSKKVRMSKVAKGVKIPTKKERNMEKKPGGSNVGEYKKVKSSEFAGPAGGAPKYSYPINTEKRAKAALSYARNAPNPEGIKRAVYRKYPDLKKAHEKRKGKKS